MVVLVDHRYRFRLQAEGDGFEPRGRHQNLFLLVRFVPKTSEKNSYGVEFELNFRGCPVNKVLLLMIIYTKYNLIIPIRKLLKLSETNRLVKSQPKGVCGHVPFRF